MTKNEIIEAINSTIVANGQKGITAESLNNILTEMTNASGSGSGDGSLKLFMPDLFLPLSIFIEDGFSRDTWSLVKTEMASYMPDIVAKWDLVFEEYWTANSLLYQSLVEKCTNNEGVSILADDSKSLAVSLEYFLEALGGGGDVDVSSCSIGTAAVSQTDGEIDYVSITLIDFEFSITLQADGSLLFERTKSILYIPLSDSNLSEAQLSANAKFASNYYSSYNESEDNTLLYHEDLGEIVVKFSTNGTIEPARRASLITAIATDSEFTGTYFEGLQLRQVVVSLSDGTTTVTTLGTLTA